jgi:hypothetical protein
VQQPLLEPLAAPFGAEQGLFTRVDQPAHAPNLSGPRAAAGLPS